MIGENSARREDRTMPQALPDALAWSLLETMILMRRFEEAVVRLAQDGHFKGHYHLYIGEEATGAAAIATLGGRDHLATTHRNHGHVIARGADPGRALAEILGRANGLLGGRGGTLHLSDPALGFLATSAIVGGCISLAVGGGYACKQRGDGSLTLALFGDGALEEGVSFEALNIAALWRLPVVFLCENNSVNAWGPGKDGFPTLNHAAKDLCSIPQSLGIPALRVDGADAAGVHAAVSEAASRCRAGGGPGFVEAITERWAGSNPLWPDPVTGVTDLRMATTDMELPQEHHEWFRHHDPVLRLVRRLAAGGADAIGRIDELDARQQRRMAAAIEFALAGSLPTAEGALDHVFA
jgi:TPP-dependent pyruvate/acetoin dehydrogenase alpha subunit